MIEELRKIVGDVGLITDQNDMLPYLQDWRGRKTGHARCVVLPASTDAVAEVVKLAAAHNEPIFPQGGNTGLCFGAVPEADDAAKPGIVLSLKRMSRVRDIDRISNLATVDAGVILANLHDLAEAQDRRFPLYLGSDGSAQIGGLISTNAGGTGVVRYGAMRDLVAGLEVVLADGSILSDLKGLKKNNTGYQLRQLFIGAEGTLGVVTGATLRLHPPLRSRAHAWIACAAPSDATALLAMFRDMAGDTIEAFELVSRSQYALVVRHVERVKIPFASVPEWSLMVELGSSSASADLDAVLSDVLERALEAGLVQDAVIAQSEGQAQDIWHVRHSVSEANKKEGVGIVHDICVRVSDVPAFIEAADIVAAEKWPNAVPMVVCHLGDGNVHYTMMFQRSDVPSGDQGDVFALEVEQAFHDVAMQFEGTISAEHGIGRKLTSEIDRLSNPVQLRAMQQVRTLFDPHNTMNPGVLLPHVAT